MKKVVDVKNLTIACSEVSFSGGKIGDDMKQKRSFTLIVDVDQEAILKAAASSWIIELQTLRDKEGAAEKVRNLPDEIKVSEIGAILGRGTRQVRSMTDEEMVAKLIGCDVSKVTPEMIALVKAMGGKE